MYLEMAADKEKKEREKNPEKYKEKKVTPIVRPDGEIRQCNEGKYRFKLREWDDADFTFFEIDVPKLANIYIYFFHYYISSVKFNLTCNFITIINKILILLYHAFFFVCGLDATNNN